MAQNTEALVIDASVAVKWALLDEEHAGQARMLLVRALQGTLTFIAPGHIRYEVPSAIWAATRGARPRLTTADGERSAIFSRSGSERLTTSNCCSTPTALSATSTVPTTTPYTWRYPAGWTSHSSRPTAGSSIGFITSAR